MEEKGVLSQYLHLLCAGRVWSKDRFSCTNESGQGVHNWSQPVQWSTVLGRSMLLLYSPEAEPIRAAILAAAEALPWQQQPWPLHLPVQRLKPGGWGFSSPSSSRGPASSLIAQPLCHMMAEYFQNCLGTLSVLHTFCLTQSQNWTWAGWIRSLYCCFFPPVEVQKPE